MNLFTENNTSYVPNLYLPRLMKETSIRPSLYFSHALSVSLTLRDFSPAQLHEITSYRLAEFLHFAVSFEPAHTLLTLDGVCLSFEHYIFSAFDDDDTKRHDDIEMIERQTRTGLLILYYACYYLAILLRHVCKVILNV